MKKLSKYFLFAFICLLSVFALVGCGDTQDDPDEGTVSGTVAVGSSTELDATFWTTTWGNNGANAKIRELIHGYGTGRLQKAIHEYLKKENNIEYHFGGQSDGGMGSTIVEFKK